MESTTKSFQIFKQELLSDTFRIDFTVCLVSQSQAMNKIRSKLFKRASGHSKNNSAQASATVNVENPLDVGLSIEYFQYQTLLFCLKKILYTLQDHEEFITMCLEQINDNPKELRALREFKESYTSNRALSWYLRDCFLYKILNYSLESQDLRNLLVCRRFLADLEKQITDHRSSMPIHAYRSQIMPTELLDRWVSSVGQCISVNSFLSATLNQDVAMTYLHNDQVVPDNYERVLLEIDADPRVIGSKPFVHIGSLNVSSDENEVLFMFGSVFLINNITCQNDGTFSIELTLYSDIEHPLRSDFDQLKQKYSEEKIDSLKFVQVLMDLDRLFDAEDYAKSYLENLSSNDENRGKVFDLLASISLSQNDINGSLRWLEESLNWKTSRSQQSQDLSTAETHENLANIYLKKSDNNQKFRSSEFMFFFFNLVDYASAFKHYTAALEIKQICLPSNHLSIAATLENLAKLFECRNEFRQAIDCLERAKAIYRRNQSGSNEKLLSIEKQIRNLSQL